MKMAIYGLPCSGKSTLISKIRGTDKDAIAEGRFSIPSDEGYSRSSAGNDPYDVIAYLDTAPDIILDRMRQSEENNRYSDLTPEDLVSWRDFEVSNLLGIALILGSVILLNTRTGDPDPERTG